MGDDPPYLTVGTEVSAKYKGAFCEAKIRKVVRVVKCRVAFKSGLGTALLSDDQIKGTLRVGATVEAKHLDKNQFCEATISKIQDCSQYTVVFDDGDITTLRRSALVLKSGRHFNESETLDQLPLTHPEHFSNPVVGGRRGARRRIANNDAEKDESSDEEETPSQKGKKKLVHELDLGKVVCVEISEKKKGKDSWFPALIVSPSAQETVKIRVKDECLVRSFKDGRYYTVPKKEITEFKKEIHGKPESNSSVLKIAVEKVMSYLDRDELPPHWDRDVLFGTAIRNDEDDGESDSEASEERQREKKDTFVAQLYKFMEERGTPINKAPVVCNKDLDLHRLYNIVTDNGGYSKVTNGGQWKNITGRLGFGTMPSTSTINLVKQAYKKYLVGFEELYKKLGCTVHSSSSSLSKPRNSRSVYRGGNASAAKEAAARKLEASEESKKEALEEKEKKALAAATTVPVISESEPDSQASVESDSKKSEVSTAEEPRRSRSRQESKTNKNKEISGDSDDKSSEKSVKKGKGKPPKEVKEKETKEVEVVVPPKEKEEPLVIKAEPPSPAPSSQGSKKGRGGRKKKEIIAEEIPPVIEKVIEEPSPLQGVGKDVKIQLGEKLSVYYPKGDQNVVYEAKVVEINEKVDSFFVHYLGWNTRYDEWIMRDRISENLSLRANYQAKSQGKGPAARIPTPTADDGDKKPRKKGRSTTPSVPTSATGTRSKTGSIKRKRMSTDFEQPAKKKRASKKTEKDESDSETSDTEGDKEKASPVRPVTPANITTPSSTTEKLITPSRASKAAAAKEKKAEEAEAAAAAASATPSTASKDSTSSKAAAEASSAEKEKEKQNQVIDLNQIRSEMKGLDKIVKTNKPSSSSATSTSPTITVQSPPGGGTPGQKLDVYDFEEETNEAPKLKMFSPRSPDKKDDNNKQVEATITTTPTSTAAVVKSKDSNPPATLSPSPSVVVMEPNVSSSTKQLKTTPVSIVLTPVTPQGQRPAMSTAPGVISTVPQVVVAVVPPPPLSTIRAVSPSTGPRTSAHHPEGKVRMLFPAGHPRHRGSSPGSSSAPPPLVPSSSLTPVVVPPTSARMQQHAAGGGLPVLSTTRPPMQAQVQVMRPTTPTSFASVSERPSSGVTPKEKVLPFNARKQELFPHLIQQQKGPLESNEDLSKLSSSPTASTSSQSHLAHPQVHKIPLISPLPSKSTSQQPTLQPTPKESPKKEKKKRVSNKKNAAGEIKIPILPTPTPTGVTSSSMEVQMPILPAKPPSRKRAKTDPSLKVPTPKKPRKSPGEKKEAKKEAKLAASGAAISRINETISTLMHKPLPTEKEKPHHKSHTPKIPILKSLVVDPISVASTSPILPQQQPIVVAKGGKATPGEKVTKVRKSSPIKGNFLKDSSGQEKPPKSHESKKSRAEKASKEKTIVPVKLVMDEKPMITSAPGPSIVPVKEEFPSVGQLPMSVTPGKSSAGGKETMTPIIAVTAPLSAASISAVPLVIPQPSVVVIENLAKPSAASIVPSVISLVPLESKIQVQSQTKVIPPPVSSSLLSELPKSFSSILSNTQQNTTGVKYTPPGFGVKSSESPLSSPVVMRAKSEEKSRPLTPSFLHTEEVMEPEEPAEDELLATSVPTKGSSVIKTIDNKEEESCSSLLCEEEIPGSPAPEDEEEKPTYDFLGEFGGKGKDGKKDRTRGVSPDVGGTSTSTTAGWMSSKVGARRGKSTDRLDSTALKKDGGDNEPLHLGKVMEKMGRDLGSGLGDNTPPSTPDSTSLSTETGGSPNADREDSGRMSPSGGGSSKSKESTDGDSGDGAKRYFDSDHIPRKSGKNQEPPSPVNTRSRSTGRNVSPPSKRRRVSRKKSPDDSKLFTYRGARSSSGRKTQSGLDMHEPIIKAPPPPPPPINLGKPPESKKFGHLLANLDGVVDPEDRIFLCQKAISDLREKYIEIKTRMQVRERKEKRRKRRAREKAAAEKQARLDAAAAAKEPSGKLQT